MVTLTWSLITCYDRSSLLTPCAVTLATLSLHVLIPLSLQATDYGDIALRSRKAHTRYWGGGGPCGAPAAHTFTMCHWFIALTVCFPPRGSSPCPGGATHTLELGLPVSAVSLPCFCLSIHLIFYKRPVFFSCIKLPQAWLSLDSLSAIFSIFSMFGLFIVGIVFLYLFGASPGLLSVVFLVWRPLHPPLLGRSLPPYRPAVTR